MEPHQLDTISKHLNPTIDEQNRGRLTAALGSSFVEMHLAGATVVQYSNQGFTFSAPVASLPLYGDYYPSYVVDTQGTINLDGTVETLTETYLDDVPIHKGSAYAYRNLSDAVAGWPSESQSAIEQGLEALNVRRAFLLDGMSGLDRLQEQLGYAFVQEQKLDCGVDVTYDTAGKFKFSEKVEGVPEYLVVMSGDIDSDGTVGATTETYLNGLVILEREGISYGSIREAAADWGVESKRAIEDSSEAFQLHDREQAAVNKLATTAPKLEMAIFLEYLKDLVSVRQLTPSRWAVEMLQGSEKLEFEAHTPSLTGEGLAGVITVEKYVGENGNWEPAGTAPVNFDEVDFDLTSALEHTTAQLFANACTARGAEEQFRNAIEELPSLLGSFILNEHDDINFEERTLSLYKHLDDEHPTIGLQQMQLAMTDSGATWSVNVDSFDSAWGQLIPSDFPARSEGHECLADAITAGNDLAWKQLESAFALAASRTVVPKQTAPPPFDSELGQIRVKGLEIKGLQADLAIEVSGKSYRVSAFLDGQRKVTGFAVDEHANGLYAAMDALGKLGAWAPEALVAQAGVAVTARINEQAKAREQSRNTGR